ncbi:Flp family type IVb pilin [Nocardioides caldifontis]|uniref:Flp family type IVb pilin n=1 Tax=Nocardioides caldifontis TaxID=2588938 RepID=UPI0011E0248C|nr:Flp family type IVb pilin [Nocardioides caldifontis]
MTDSRQHRRAPARNERGASSVEYGLIAVAVAALVTAVVFALGGVVQDLFSSSCAEIEAQASTAKSCTT